MRVNAMKARTKKNIGEITAWTVVVIAILIGLNKFFSSDNATNSHAFTEMVDENSGFMPTPKEKSIGNFLRLLGYLSALILSAVYGLSLRRKKLATAQSIYRTWWVLLLIPFCLVLVLSLVSGNSLGGFLRIALVLMLSYLPVGIVTFLYWTGLKGLEQMVAENDPE